MSARVTFKSGKNIPLERILESGFRFKEQVLYRVQIEFGPISLVRQPRLQRLDDYFREADDPGTIT